MVVMVHYCFPLLPHTAFVLIRTDVASCQACLTLYRLAWNIVGVVVVNKLQQKGTACSKLASFVSARNAGYSLN